MPGPTFAGADCKAILRKVSSGRKEGFEHRILGAVQGLKNKIRGQGLRVLVFRG